MPRDTDRSQLHPLLRSRLVDLDARLNDAGLPLALYEGARSPFRQAELYARGRSAGERGKTVTRARAWESFHQYGFAADYVFRDGERWSWEEPKRGAWEMFARLAAACGLRSLSFERPHVELPLSLQDLQAARFPAGGDDLWLHSIETQIETWGGSSRSEFSLIHPAAPPLPSLAERPALPVEA
jgi:peptidoglycan L-alanyl-D-glutamate endopeptidase CwlK